MPQLRVRSVGSEGSLREGERWLSAQERAIYECLAPRRRSGWLAGRLAAKALLQEHAERAWGIEVRPWEVEIERTAWGGVRGRILGEPAEGSLSISHWKHQGLAGLAGPGEGSLGVDLERRRRLHPRWAERVLHPHERSVLRRIDPLAVWTLKEAAFKALGPRLGGRAVWTPRALQIVSLVPSAPDSGNDRLRFRAAIRYAPERGPVSGGQTLWVSALALRRGAFWVAWALCPPGPAVSEGPTRAAGGREVVLPDPGP